ncbi:MAG: lipid-binding SYLF domain-containing protein [Acidobacteriaceae bacterium]|nr:lipid-binding SYLF domain-containing protein [Acidobacteriota bacterium]MBV9503106.1 lipid-binding SYLF domain-containing protein [Acidobacteriaceae bacterium]
MSIKMLIAPLLALSLPAMGAESDTQRLNTASDVLKEIMTAPDKGIPGDLFHKAYCVVVIPNMKKAGFVFSAKYGRGFATCRDPKGTGWTAPAGLRVEGGGFGLQAGGEGADIVMLVMSDKGMQGILASKFTLGGEASVAAGPVGRDATAQTDATMRADILSWSRSRGVFGGMSLQGGTLRADDDANKAIYGQKESNKEILTGKVQPPADASSFLQEVAQYGGESRKS